MGEAGVVGTVVMVGEVGEEVGEMVGERVGEMVDEIVIVGEGVR